MLLRRRIITVFILLVFSSAALAENTACESTPQSFLGNSHIPGVASYRTDVGKGLTIKGRVLSARDCSPLPDALIERWQAGNSGRYEDRFRALMKPQKDGSYQFETEWPNMPTPHIHFIVTAAGYQKLVTQWIPDQSVSQQPSEAEFNLILTPE